MAGSGTIARRNESFLARHERRLLAYLAARIPPAVTSLHLSILGFFGSVLASIGLLASNFHHIWILLVIAGLALNWFGDSLDGTLARYRRQERPRFGFLVDHTLDLFSFILLIVSFGLSPFLSLISAFVILLCYLLFSAYTYIRAAAHHVHQMAYIGVGATEFRILMAVWATLGAIVGLNEPIIGRFTTLDFVIMVLGAMAVVGLGIKAAADARIVAREEEAAAGGSASTAMSTPSAAVNYSPSKD